MDAPQQGSEIFASELVINGVQLAIKEAGGKAGPFAIDLPRSLLLDDAVNGTHDPETGAFNVGYIVADPSVVALIGPLISSVARAELPISNAAGLAHCSPGTTMPGLTRDPAAAALRDSPNNFVRVATNDDVDATLAAQYLYETLELRRTYVVDDADAPGSRIADAFEAAFEALGGMVTGRDSIAPGAGSLRDLLVAAKGGEPGAIVYVGSTRAGGADVLFTAADVGLGELPFMVIGADGISDGSVSVPGSFLSRVGTAASHAHTVLTEIQVIPEWEAFEHRYLAEYGSHPTVGAAQGYACAQILLNAIERAILAFPGADAADLREAVRVALTDTKRTYSTVLGNINFDRNGNPSQIGPGIWTFDETTRDWSFEAEVQYDPR
jgi:ABC-type branched-subunit amino acid transport system substrate-binding protein